MAVALVGVALSRSFLIEDAAGPSDQSPVWCAASPTDPAAPAGLLGLPPHGATPSSTARADLVVHYFGIEAGREARVWVFDDGRLIVERQSREPFESTGYRERCLTPQGVEALRSYVNTEGEAPGGRSCCPLSAQLKVRQGNQLVDLGPRTINPRRLYEPESWLPPDAWVDEDYRAYIPAEFAVCYGEGTYGGDMPPTVALNSMPTPVADLLRTEVPAGDYGGLPPDGCWVVTTDEARAIVEAVDDPELGRGDHGLASLLVVLEPHELPAGSDPEGGDLRIFPVLPDDTWMCTICG